MDLDTFVTYVYVMVDDYCKAHLAPDRHPGPGASLSRSEVITLAMIGQWFQFASERDFYETISEKLGSAFPCLPDRSQYNRQVRRHAAALGEVGIGLGRAVGEARPWYEAMDSVAAPVRNAKRRGCSWLDGRASLGWSNRLGWFFGFRVLTCCSPRGVLTGYGCAPGATNDRLLAETLFASRATPHPRLPNVGHATDSVYLADSNFAGAQWVPRWRTAYGVTVLASPQRDHPARWPRPLRRWVASHRQIIETVHDRLIHCCRLETDRAHTLPGFLATLAAKVALHNACCLINHRLGRPLLATRGLLRL